MRECVYVEPYLRGSTRSAAHNQQYYWVCVLYARVITIKSFVIYCVPVLRCAALRCVDLRTCVVNATSPHARKS